MKLIPFSLDLIQSLWFVSKCSFIATDIPMLTSELSQRDWLSYVSNNISVINTACKKYVGIDNII